MKSVKSIVSIMLCLALLAGCGGGPGKSGVKGNEYLGNLPTLYADLELAEDADEAKLEKVEKSGNYKKYVKLEAELEQAEEKRDAKFETAGKAEWEKINGKDVPFTCSEDFNRLNMEITSVKLDASSRGIVITAKAKQDFSIYTMNYSDYNQINFRVLAKDGSIIDKTAAPLAYIGFNGSIPYKKGEDMRLNGKDPRCYLRISGSDAAKWSDFASVEFITSAEYVR